MSKRCRIHQIHQFGHPTFQLILLVIFGHTSLAHLILCSQATVGRTMMRAKHAKATLKPIAFNGAPNVSVERRSPAAQVKRSMRKDNELDKISVSKTKFPKTLYKTLCKMNQNDLLQIGRKEFFKTLCTLRPMTLCLCPQAAVTIRSNQKFLRMPFSWRNFICCHSISHNFM